MIIGIEAQRIFRRKKHGMDFVVLETIRELQRLDQENQYVIFVSEGPDRCLEETANFKIHPLRASYPVFEQYHLPRLVKEYGCELLHVTSNTGPVNCPVPMIQTLHDIIYYESVVLFKSGYSYYQRLGNLYRKMVVKRVARQAKKVLTVSNFEKKKIIEALRLPPHKVQTVYNGVGEHFLERPADDQIETIRAKYELPEHYLLFLGNTDPKKNTPNTLEAFARFSAEVEHPYQLVVGDFSIKELKKILDASGLGNQIDRFLILGYIENTDLPEVFAGAELFLYTSRRESFGIPILEAMGVGTPVLTSNTSSMPEVGGDAVALVNPESVEDIANAIYKLLSDDELRQSLRDKGVERVKRFTWKEAARQVLRIYQNIL